MPSDVGFQDSFMPTPYVYENSTISVNGQDVPTAGAHFLLPLLRPQLSAVPVEASLRWLE